VTRIKKYFFQTLFPTQSCAILSLEKEAGDSESISLRPITLSGKTLAVVAGVFV